MVDVAHPSVVPGSMTVTQSRTSWGLEMGRHRLSVTRTREARTIGGIGGRPRPRAAVKPAWPLTIGAFASVSAFGLFVVGAIASEPSLPHQSRYSLSLPVPVRAAKAIKGPASRGAGKARARSAHSDAPDLSGPRFDGADEPYVIRAMQAGEFQEWLGPDGQRRFLNAGPELADGDRRCRDLALLIRHPDGSSRTRTARRCASQPPERTMAAVTQIVPAPRALTTSDMADLPPSEIGAPPAYAQMGEEDQGASSGR